MDERVNDDNTNIMALCGNIIILSVINKYSCKNYIVFFLDKFFYSFFITSKIKSSYFTLDVFSSCALNAQCEVLMLISFGKSYKFAFGLW